MLTNHIAGYPESLLYKLYVRQAMCFEALEKNEIANVCWKKALENAETLEDETLRKDAETFIRKHQASERETIRQRNCSVAPKKEYKVETPHPQYPSFSDKLE